MMRYFASRRREERSRRSHQAGRKEREMGRLEDPFRGNPVSRPAADDGGEDRARDADAGGHAQQP